MVLPQEEGKKRERWRKRKEKIKNWGQEESPGAGRDGKKQIRERSGVFRKI